MTDGTKTLRILHFNDVYHVAASDQEPVGGAARFGHLLHKQQEIEPSLTLFSGDAYFPSLESTISRGEHMLPVLNELNIDAATLGNHEFDHGLEVLEGLIGRNNFPWIATNLTDKAGGVAARGSVSYFVKSVAGVRVGIMGIVEKEWLDTLPCLPPTFEYHDFVKSARSMAKQMREEMKCDLVVCLSHMRLNNDVKLADACPDVDLVLSGHDHFYYIGSGVDEYEDPDLAQLPDSYSGRSDDESMLETWKQERAQLAGSTGRRLVKSGTDFRDLSEITLELETVDGVMHIAKMQVRRHRTLSSIPEEPAIGAMVDKIETHLGRALDKTIGYTTEDLDARSSVCRTQESNMGSLSGDLMRMCYAESAGAQIALLCGGAIRSDKVFPAGAVRMRDIMEVFPFEDPVVVVRLTGDQIRRALENGVSKWPAHEGRFPQVSGIRFVFDPRREPGQRITSIVVTAAAKAAAKRHNQGEPEKKRRMSVAPSMQRMAVENARGRRNRSTSGDSSETGSDTESDVESDVESDYGDEADEELDMHTLYTVATRDYMYTGHDGYESLTEGELVVDEENGITFADLFRRYFGGLAVCNALAFNKRGLASSCAAVRRDGQSEWRRLIIKHADNLRDLARQRDSESPQTDSSSNDPTASKIAQIVDRFSNHLAQKATKGRHRGSRIVRALTDSARRLTAEDEPVRVARAALFGREGGQEIPDSGRSTPRNDDAGGLMPRLLINRSDTRTHASESVVARWAVVSPTVDGRITRLM
ncbi:hypothetical protein IWW46_004510 [Coemansia sp. RSA 2440]|nr:hypothetical protein IWW46_004510 [Coemansia sp. RSA 2440]